RIFLLKYMPVIKICALWILREHSLVFDHGSRPGVVEFYEFKPQSIEIALYFRNIQVVFLHMEQKVTEHGEIEIIGYLLNAFKHLRLQQLAGFAPETKHPVPVAGIPVLLDKPLGGKD